jgi:uncharacterized protein DUF1707
MPDPQLRAADTDREAVAATLGRALSDGRLTVDEYEERLAKAYAARTYADLDPLTADLPRTGATHRSTPAPAPTAPPVPRPAGMCGQTPWARTMRSVWASWLTTALIVTTIWLATSIGNGHPDYFWPIWVIGPWGAMLLARTITGGPHHPRDRHRPRYR